MRESSKETASFHLSKPLDAEMLTCRKQGRHRYYRLKNGKIAQSLETLLNIAPPAEIRSFRQSAEDRAVRKARTCYDHLAGSLGVTLVDRLVEMGVLKEEETAFTVTEEGEAFLKELGIDVREVKKKRRSFCHKCLDWSERRHHIAGALGSALLDAFIRMGWIGGARIHGPLQSRPPAQRNFTAYFIFPLKRTEEIVLDRFPAFRETK